MVILTCNIICTMFLEAFLDFLESKLAKNQVYKE